VIGETEVARRRRGGVRQGWDRFIGTDGAFVGMHSFGASAPDKALYPHFGITPEGVAAAAKAKL
jgi:transketolase